jgi:hypothetical protein
MGSQSITLNTTQRVWQSPQSNWVAAAGAQPNVTATEPTQGNNAINVVHGNLAKLVFITANADLSSAVSSGSTHDTSVYSWSSAAGIWIPTYIATFKSTSGSSTGIAGKNIGDGIYFCKDVELVDGDTSCRIIGGANLAETVPGSGTGDGDVISSATIDVEGASYLSFRHVGRVTTADRFGAMVAVF